MSSRFSYFIFEIILVFICVFHLKIKVYILEKYGLETFDTYGPLKNSVNQALV